MSVTQNSGTASIHDVFGYILVVELVNNLHDGSGRVGQAPSRESVMGMQR